MLAGGLLVRARMRHLLVSALLALCVMAGCQAPGPSAAPRPLTQAAAAVSATPAPAGDGFTLDEVSRRQAAFKGWLGQYLAAPPSARAALLADGEALAAARRPALRWLLLTDPQAALTFALSPVDRAQLPDGITKHLEQWRDGRGDLKVLGGLSDTAPLPVERFVSFAGSSERLRAGVFGRRLGQLTREGLRLHGVSLDGAVALTESPVRRLFPFEVPRFPVESRQCGISRQAINDATLSDDGDSVHANCTAMHSNQAEVQLVTEEDAAGATAATSWTQGVKQVLFIRVDFSDVAGDPISDTSAKALIDTTTSTFYAVHSYGKTSMVSTVTATLRMPQTAAAYVGADNYTGLMTDAYAAAKTAGQDPANFDLAIVAFAHQGGAWGGWSGRGYVGGKGTWINGDFTLRVAGHELGHNYGVNHANFWNAGTSIFGAGTNVEYGNPFDMMSSGGNTSSDFNAWFKRLFDWVPSAETQVVSTSGTYRIYALEQPITSGLHALKLPRADARDFWFEYRPNYGNTQLANGASVNLGFANSGSGSELLDMTPDGDRTNSALLIGTTFDDPLQDVHVTPVGKGGTTPESLDLVVNLGPFPGNRAPTVTLSASSLTPAAGVAVTFTATASDPDGDALAYAWELDDGSLGTNTATVTRTWSTPRDYHVRVTASDMKGQKTSASVVVTVGTPTTFTLAGTVGTSAGPLGNVRVTDGTHVAFTDSLGHYTLTQVAAGTPTLSASAFDYAFTRSFAAPLTVAGSMTGLDFLATAAPGYSITGKVTNGGVGLAGVTVSTGLKTAVTDASGTYTLTTVPNGRYTLTATLAGWQFQGSSSLVEVYGGNVANANFYAVGNYLSGSIPGTVTATPVVTDGLRTATVSNYNGQWNWYLSGVPDGTWNLVATATGFALQPSNFTNPVVLSGVGRNNLNFGLDTSGGQAVSGTVKTGTTPLPGVQVTDGTRTVTTDSAGHYTLLGVPAGTYTLTPSGGSYTYTPATRSITVAAAPLTGQDFATTVVNLPPTVVTVATAAPTTVTGNSTTLSVLATDDGGEANLTYTWTSNIPASVSFSASGTNAAKLSTATFTQSGYYTLECTVTDQGGLSVRSQVTVIVNPVPTTLVVTPGVASVTINGSQTFTGLLSDQFGRQTYSGTPTWSVSGGGTLAAASFLAQTFTAAATPGGPYTVTLAYGGKTATANVTVTPSGTPTIVTQAQATPEPVTGTTTHLTVLGADDGTEANLTYHWAVTGPSGVTFSANDSNAARSATATFTQVGEYDFTVTATDLDALSVQSAVHVSVQPVAASIVLQPQVVTLQVGSSQPFTATVEDQFGAPLSSQPVVSFSVSGGGTIDGAGVFTAGPTPGGPFTVTATVAGVTATAQLSVGAAPDTAPPTVQLTQPVAGANLLTSTTLVATASDNVGVTQVEFFVDTTSLGVVSQAPWSLAFDPTTVAQGSHVLTAKASDAAGNHTTSDGVSVTTGPQAPVDTTPPTVSLTSPTEGATLPTHLTLSATASDDVGVTQVAFEVDGQVVGQASAAPWSATVELAVGTHTAVAIAHDAAGHLTRSDAVSFTVGTDAPPQGPPEQVLGGCGCQSGASTPFSSVVLLAGLLWRSRRRA